MLWLLACTPASWEATPLTAEVRPIVGTGGLGFGYGGLNPGPLWPNGLAKPGPDTALGSLNLEINHSAGYYWGDDTVTGFSHHRLPGIGVGDGGALGFLPLDSADLDREGWPLDHALETARLGYYAIDLEPAQVELAATRRTAAHRYSWHSEARWLRIDLDHTGSANGAVAETDYTLVDGRTVTGFVDYRGGLTGRGEAGIPLHFVATFSEPWAEAIPTEQRLLLRFDHDVQVKVGLSVTDLDGAWRNLEAEQPGWDFQGLVLAAAEAWEAEVFDHVRVAGGTPEQRRRFATALYDTRMMPTVFGDVDGRYRAMDREIHSAEGWTYYTDMSLWDSYRTLHPWTMLAFPEQANDFARSLADMGEKGGFLPRWPAGMVDSGSMHGQSAEVVLGESLAKGIDDWPVQATWAIAEQQSITGTAYERPELQAYLDYGFIPHDVRDGGVAYTLEYAIDDAALALWADYLALDEQADALRARSGNYVNHYNPESGFMQGRNSDGSWVPLDDELWPDVYVEGNRWQYSWLAPHDPEGLADLYGGPEALRERLTELFELSAAEEDTFLPDPYYWHGNEPDLHYAWLFAAVGYPADSQKWVRWVLDTKYPIAPGGLDGNDDGGTLSAWYCFAAIGLYPLNGTDRYVLGTPLFDAVELDALSIHASGEGPYIAGAWLNGQPLESAVLTHAQLQGAEIRVVRSGEPTDWGQR